MKPILKLIAVNILLLFVLGFGTFSDFVQANLNVNPDIFWTNHSIYGFGKLMKVETTGLYIVIAVCLCFAYYRRNLLLPLTLAAMLLPSISHDYKLPILAFPVAMIQTQNAATLGIYLLYSITLFSYVTKPPWLANNLPILFGLLILSIISDNTNKKENHHVDFKKEVRRNNR